ncbi:MAG: FAD:protein FMN transferase [Paracoccaceae bacterium]
MKRRRFLTIWAAATAAAATLPGRALPAPVLWNGRGLGAALSLRLDGADPARAALTFARIEAEIARLEALFSLHRDSALTRLNRDGRLAWPSPDMLDILALGVRVHRATDGAFDPTVQPLWQALVTGGDPAPARAAIGFGRVVFAPQGIRLDRGQALTLNGIAQGWAADRIATLLRAEGYASALIDMGEIAAVGAPQGRPAWQVGLADTGAQVALCDRALATSAPGATRIGAGLGHILGPQGQPPLWRLVSVSAPAAGLADALSTAFCLMPREAIDATLSAFPEARLHALEPLPRHGIDFG